MSLPIEDILDVLRQKLPPNSNTLLQAIAKELIAAEQELKDEKKANAAPKAKSRFIIALRGDPKTLGPLVAGGGWVLAVNQDDPATASTLFDRIVRSVRQFNDTLKGKRKALVIKTFVDAMRGLKPKAIKVAVPEAVFAIKTRDPVEVVVVEQESI